MSGQGRAVSMAQVLVLQRLRASGKILDFHVPHDFAQLQMRN